jgi:4,5-DOPA dioxygenase extradiol
LPAYIGISTRNSGAIVVVSAHWEAAPLTIGATTSVPLVYDFYGFPARYYRITYPAPGAPEVSIVAPDA